MGSHHSYLTDVPIFQLDKRVFCPSAAPDISIPAKPHGIAALPGYPISTQVERFLFRPGLQERARYYAIVFLNQLVLSHRVSPQRCAWCIRSWSDQRPMPRLFNPTNFASSPLPTAVPKDSEGGSGLAKKLVELYFTMFRMVIEGHFGRAGEARK